MAAEVTTAATIDEVEGPIGRPVQQSTPRLRVLHIVESYSAGVATALESYLHVTADVVDHHVLGYRRPWAQIGPRPERGFTDLPAGRRAQLSAIRAQLKTTNADVIHVHSSWAGMFARIVHRNSMIPIVFTPHCYAFERTDVSRTVRWGYRRIESILARRTSAVAAVGRREADLARELRPTIPVIVVPHVLPEPLGAVSHPTLGQQLVVATLARVAAQKGVDYFLEVVAETRRLAAEAPHFVWIGGGDCGLTQRLERAGVEVTGWLTRSAAIERLTAANAYVHTAAWEAAWPISLLEAAQLGLPVISRVIESTIDLPAPFRADSASAMARQVSEWCDDPASRVRSVEQADEFCANLPGPKEAAALLKVYHQALALAPTVR
jgi:glycosyltransferase involved in cell wall biosynthesis